VFAPASGEGRVENAGYDAFVPLIASGISGYFWIGPRFLSFVLYTCKGFDESRAVAFTATSYGSRARSSCTRPDARFRPRYR
jgi:hypothetical protein